MNMKTLYFTDWNEDDETIEKEMGDINLALNGFGVKDCDVTESTQIPPFKGHSEENTMISCSLILVVRLLRGHLFIFCRLVLRVCPI